MVVSVPVSSFYLFAQRLLKDGVIVVGGGLVAIQAMGPPKKKPRNASDRSIENQSIKNLKSHTVTTSTGVINNNDTIATTNATNATNANKSVKLRCTKSNLQKRRTSNTSNLKKRFGMVGEVLMN